MNTLKDIATTLRRAVARRAVRQADLKAEAGISQRTLTNVLSGTADYKLSTLLALADRLGLDLLLVPKGAAAGVEAGWQVNEPAVKTRVAAALERVRAAPGTE
jgi:transcriptional regulator with XRE-family HTH domain